MTSVVSAEVSVRDLSRALDGFVAAVGADHVLTDEADLREFRDPFAYETWDDYTASAVVMPETVEEIQEIVRVANEHKVPLWTHGTGRNNGYGGPAPRVRGSVILSLRRMNRVLEIDEELGYAVVEPGVRWFDLYEAIQAGGHKLMLSVPDLGWGSVVGNTLDHGITYLPYGTDMAAQCGMEVVLPNGELMRTGMGAMPGNRSWNLYKRGLGPTPDQLFMQSELRHRHEDGHLADAVPGVLHAPLAARLARRRSRPRCRHAAPADARPDDRPRAAVPEHDPARLRDDEARALASGGGPDPRRGHRQDGPRARDRPLDDALRPLRRRGGGRSTASRRSRRRSSGSPARRSGARSTEPEQFPQIENAIERVQAGVPSLDLNEMTGWYGGEHGGHIGFSPVAPLVGRDALALRDLLRGMIEQQAGLDYMAALIPTNARSFVHVTLVIFDTQNEAQARRVRHLQAARARGGEAGLRRVPGAPRLHGPRRRPVQLQRPRLPALQRDDQGRARPERDPLTRQAGNLAEGMREARNGGGAER